MATRRKPTSPNIRQLEDRIDDHESRIDALEKAKIGTDAVADYLLKHPTSVPLPESRLNKDLIKYVGVALGIIAALIYLLQGVLQGFHP